MKEHYYRTKLFRLTGKIGMAFLLYLLCIVAIARAAEEAAALEKFINHEITSYPFEPDNQFKLAAYAELKGRYHLDTEAFVLPFGKLGTLSFFRDHCLLKVGSDGYLSLNRTAANPRTAIELNIALENLFEQIKLLANWGASEEQVQFVDQHLAKKNLDPFDKIYTRHLLLKYGRYNPQSQALLFHTDWLPQELSEEELVKQYRIPLGMKLDSSSLRGYYLGTGGEVFVEDVDRNVHFATGEQTQTNVSAFKLFVQKLFTETVNYLPKQTQSKSQTRSQATSSRPVLYPEDGWIPMMLGLLRAHETNIGDSDVIRYFQDQPCFPHIYAQMTLEERAAADRSLARGK